MNMTSKAPSARDPNTQLKQKSAPIIEFSMLVSTTPITKSYRLDDGNIAKKPAANITTGIACNHKLSSLPELAKFLDGLDSETAITCGLAKIPVGQASVEITTTGNPKAGAIARTNKNYDYPEGGALFPIDHDAETHTHTQLMVILGEICPAFTIAMNLTRGSTSSGVHRRGEEASANPTKFHTYVGVENGRDIPRFAKVLFKQLILNGHGNIMVTSNGVPLVRTLIDSAIYQGSRLFFEGRPVLTSDELEYTRPACAVTDGKLLDTSLLPDLTAAEEHAYDDAIRKLKTGAESAISAARELYSDRMKAQGLSVESISTVLKGKTLPADFIVKLASGIEVSVGDILADPDKYDREQCYDLGNPDGKATRTTIYAKGSNPAIHDYRSGTQYRLLGGTREYDKHPGKDSYISTFDNLKHLMETEMEIDHHYDAVLKAAEVKGLSDLNGGSITLRSMVLSHSQKAGLPKSLVEDHLAAVMRSNVKNPLLGIVKAVEWDGVDRIAGLEKRLGSPSGTLEYRKQALTMWLVQCVAAWDGAESTPNKDAIAKYEAILVLVGGQGVSKTTFFTKLMPDGMARYLDTGAMLKTSDRDSVKQLTSFGMVELGELDGTMKKNEMADLKAFMSKQTDTYRAAYGRDDERHKRRTSFGASVNVAQFLRDSTGARRFMCLGIPAKINLDDFDVMQLWAQIWHLYLRGQAWWPTTGDAFSIAQAEVNDEATDHGSVGDVMLDFIAVMKHTTPDKHQRRGATKIWESLTGRVPNDWQTAGFREALNKAGFTATAKNGVSIPADWDYAISIVDRLQSNCSSA